MCFLTNTNERESEVKLYEINNRIESILSNGEHIDPTTGEWLGREDLDRLDIEMADKARERCIYACNGLVYKEGHYYYRQYISTGHGERENLQGPYTLQQCHDKLKELTGET